MDPFPKDTTPDYRFAMLGLKDGRDRLVSGVYQASGVLTESDPVWGELRGDVHLYCSFDTARRVIRFDRRQPFRQLIDSSKPQPKKERSSWKLAERWTQYILKEDGTVYFHVDGTSVVSATSATQNPRLDEPPFDVKSGGLLYWIDYSRGTTFDQLFPTLAARKPTEVLAETDKLTRIVWDVGSTRSTLWLDRTAGFGPVRLETRDRKKDTSGKVFYSEPTITSEVSWQKINDVWVPKTFRLRTDEQANAPKSIELAFDWVSVNKPIPPEDLTVEGFKVRRESRLVDYTGPKPEIIDVLEANPEKTFYPDAARYRWLYWLLLILIVVVALYGGYRFVKRRQTKTVG